MADLGCGARKAAVVVTVAARARPVTVDEENFMV